MILLQSMINENQIEGYSGFIDLSDSDLYFEESNFLLPFRILDNTTYPSDGSYQSRERGSVEIGIIHEDRFTNELLLGDNLSSLDTESPPSRRIQEVLIRNRRAVNRLKQLYNGECQLTGTTYTFIKSNGERYSEAHHLIPLGQHGDDSPYNIIIVSPLIHRMLHYARVSGLDLSRINNNHNLNITINGQPYTIRWHPSHADLVRHHQS